VTRAATFPTVFPSSAVFSPFVCVCASVNWHFVPFRRTASVCHLPSPLSPRSSRALLPGSVLRCRSRPFVPPLLFLVDFF